MTRYIKCSGIILGIMCYLYTCTALAQNTIQQECVTGENGNLTDSTDKLIEIPFGTRSREELNYAQSSLRYNQLTKVPISNLSGLLAGRLSGFLFRWTGNQPGGGNVSYQIRGRSSYAQGSSPAFLVDGIERDFEDMDISEIKSVTVLKDAAALNWYGLNGGNGAILVTTKRGKVGENLISFDAQGGFQSASNLIKPLNSFDFATLYNRGLTNAGQAPAYNDAALEGYKNHTDPYLYPDNNYLDRFLNKRASTQRYALIFSGGNDRVRYFSSVSYFNQQGLFKETETPNYDSNYGYKRYNFRINLDYDVTKTLTLTLLAGLRSEVRNDVGDGTSTVFSNLYNLPPNAFPILNADGSYGGTSLFQNNPLGQLQATGFSRTTTNILLASIMADQKLDFITRGLSANLFFSYDGYGNYGDGLSENYAVFNQTVTPVQTYRTPAVIAYRTAAFQTNTKNNELWFGLDYNRTIATDHQIKANVRAQQYVSAAVDRLDYRSRMLLGRADYSFKQRYMLGFTGSYSGSENYAPGRRFGFFPAVSAGWLISKEDFLKDASVISYLKLRGSYGRSGNIGPTYDASGNVVRLPYRTLFTRDAGPFLGSTFSTSTTARLVSPAGNPLTTWEKIDRLNLGTDVDLFKGAFSFSFDYFDEKRTDILGPANLPGIVGIAIAQVNSGKVSSKGFDASGTFNKKIGEVLISTNANFTYAKNVILERTENVLPNQSTIGRYVNGGNYYIAEGIFQSQAEINASPRQTLSSLVVPGDLRYKDVNNDNVIDANDAVSSDYTDIPKIFYGFGFNIKYKQFDFGAQFQGVEGRTVDLSDIMYAGPNGLNQLSLDTWTPATAASAKYPRVGISDNGNNTVNSTFWLYSGDFLKLRSAEIGYSTPRSLNQRLRFKGARIFVSGNNIFSISKLDDLDIDPETPNAGRFSSYPYVKTFAVGINVKF
ncbi:SusC/RagA family TonB-linked outer membrane protein [Pedobacter rhizosphaerae]|uniref:TonB-linked outer membrane protein, SusC/RagA family n=1 Tax=Pedobacter rhizosphaerae TaxID=390241 RepID=A0A1H9TK23_9SPHI|nr:SusC/RagA family TonB-linked outer membrane protein [Pedobacter rhizosphaerae]SER97670.1 TonB-linked outer membrane protein, SusC/RagA family [Pedobacter rhizosphaerae]